jgi:hypothetical protein
MALCLPTLPLPTAQAAIDQLTIQMLNSGTLPFDSLDANETNADIRTHDTVDYRVSIVTNGNDTDPRLELTLPVGTPPNGYTGPLPTVTARWAFVPPQCDNSSTISTDGRVLTCELADAINPNIQVIDVRMRIDGQSPNGTQQPAPTAHFFSSAEPSGVLASGSLPTLTVRAAPRWDAYLSARLDPPAKARLASGPNGEAGYIWPIAVSLRRDASRKGIEALTNNLTLNVSLNAPSGVRPLTWPVPNTVLNDSNACLNPANRLPFEFPGDVPGDQGPQPSQANNVVANGGGCTLSQPGGVGTGLVLNLVGLDSTLNHFPAEISSTSPLVNPDNPDAPQNRYFVSVKTIYLWFPRSDLILGETRTISATLSAPGLASISGQANLDPDLLNNHISDTIERQVRLGTTTTYETLPANGSGFVGCELFCSPLDYVQPFFRYSVAHNVGNSSSEAITNVAGCIKIDNTRQLVSDLTLLPPGTLQPFQKQLHPSGVYAGRSQDERFVDNGAAIVVEWGVGGTAGSGATWNSYSNLTDPGQTPSTSGSAQADANCGNNDSPAWFSSLQALQTAGYSLQQVTKLRYQIAGDLQPGDGFGFFFGLQARQTYAFSTTDQINNAPVVRAAGDSTINSIAPLQSHLTSVTLGSGAPIERRADATQVVTDTNDFFPLRPTFASLSHQTIVPPDRSQIPVGVGTRLRYSLGVGLSSFRNLSLPITTTIVLPPYLSLITGTVTLNGATIADPQSFSNDPLPNHTRLVFPLTAAQIIAGGDLQFAAQISLLVPNNTRLLTSAFVTLGSANCTYQFDEGFTNCGAINRRVQVSNPPGFRLGLRTSDERIEPGETTAFSLDYLRTAGSISDLTLLAVLPYQGDNRTPPSQLPNGYTLQTPLVPAGPTITTYYTREPAATIGTNPTTQRNTIGQPGSIWCAQAQLGTGNCPAVSLNNVTALLFAVDGILPIDTLFSIQIPLSANPGMVGDRYTLNYTASSPDLPVVLTSESRTTSVVLAGLSGAVYSDRNNNGARNVNEGGIVNVPIELECTATSCGSGTRWRTTTNPQGEYGFVPGATSIRDGNDLPIANFVGLPAGTYTIRQLLQPAGFNDGIVTPGSFGGIASNNQITTIVVPSGGVGQNYLFGERLVANIDLQLLSAPTAPRAGETVEFSYLVRNTGPQDASGSQFVLASSVPISNLSTGCTTTGGTVCGAFTQTPSQLSSELTAFPNNGTATITISGRLGSDATGNLETSAILSPTLLIADPVTTDNSAATSAAIQVYTDVGVTITNNRTSLIADTSVPYTLVITNSGPATANNARLISQAPTAAQFLGWTCQASAGSDCPANGTGNLNMLLNLLPGGSATVQVVVDIEGSAAGIIDIQASVTAAQGTTDPSSANNQASDADPVLPPTPAAPFLADESDSGAKGDRLTNDTTPNIRGQQGPVGMTVKLFNGTTQVGIGTVNSSNDWSVTIGPLADGEYVLTARYSDSAGNDGPASAAFTFTVDALTPIIAVDLPILTNGISVRDPIISGVSEPGSQLVVEIDPDNNMATNNSRTYEIVVPANGSWQIDLRQPPVTPTGQSVLGLVPGRARVSITARDLADNQSNRLDLVIQVRGMVYLPIAVKR